MKGHWIVEVSEDGRITVEGHDFGGNACDLPKDVLEALGVLESAKRKPAYYQAAGQAVKGKVR